MAAELDIDAADPVCCHALALVDGVAVATGRVQADGHIGRVAVLKDSRGQGVGHALVVFLAAEAGRLGLTSVYLNAQLSAAGFYEKMGFRRVGKTFVEAGIDHVRMEHES